MRRRERTGLVPGRLRRVGYTCKHASILSLLSNIPLRLTLTKTPLCFLWPRPLFVDEGGMFVQVGVVPSEAAVPERYLTFPSPALPWLYWSASSCCPPSSPPPCHCLTFVPGMFTQGIPGVYTSVAYYRSWILAILNDLPRPPPPPRPPPHPPFTPAVCLDTWCVSDSNITRSVIAAVTEQYCSSATWVLQPSSENTTDARQAALRQHR